MSALDLPALQRVVEAAVAEARNTFGDPRQWAGEMEFREAGILPAGATFIATFHPETVGALLGEVDRLRIDCASCRNLVARLNGDGGHHQDAVGLAQAAQDAEARVIADWRAHDAAMAEIRAHLDRAIAPVDVGGGERVAASALATELARLRRVEALGNGLVEAFNATEGDDLDCELPARIAFAYLKLKDALTEA